MPKECTILFTHDIHSYFTAARSKINGVVREHGNAARMKTLIDRNRDANTIYVDGGDFSVGTLLQTASRTDAIELVLMGHLGCDATTFGNHEFDSTAAGLAQMLEAAIATGKPLPKIVQSNIRLDITETENQKAFAAAAADYGICDSLIFDRGGLHIGIFALMGPGGIQYSPKAGLEFEDYIQAAKRTVAKLRSEGADVIVCLSHSGTKNDGATGDDVELAKAVPEINVIISGHTHSTFDAPVYVGSTLIASAGEYLTYLGKVTLSVSDGKVAVKDYQLIPCDESIPEDPATAEILNTCKQKVQDDYLADKNCTYDQIICRADFDFMALSEMHARHEEFPLGNMIADSYIYAAHQNGIDDIDAAIVGLGTIRSSIFKGDVTVSDIFNLCALGVGADGSAGHAILVGYASGRDLKLVAELDATVSPLMSSIKMNYSGMHMAFNEKRIPLDRAYDVCLVRADGTREELQDDRLYKVAINMYAANMLSTLGKTTKGILSITPKNADGTPVTDLNSCAIRDANGREVKEWVAVKDYLASFPVKDGLPTIPERYAAPEGRKEKVNEGGLAIFAHPGPATIVVIVLSAGLVLLIAVLILTHKKRKLRRQARKAEKEKRKG